MKKLHFAAMAAGLGLLVAPPAFADTQTLAKVGAWTAFGGTTSDGTPVCGVSISGNGLFFSLKIFKGDDDMTAQLGSKNWKIKDGGKQKLSMRFDNQKAWTATATGFHFKDGDAGLEFAVPLKNLEVFITEFARSQKLRIIFDGSDADSWSADLTGTAAITSAFADCAKKKGL